MTWPSGVCEPSWLFLGWGAAFFDFDNDGWLDLFVANGHVYPEVDRINVGASYRERPRVHMNQRGAGFKEVGFAMGGALARQYCARGGAFGGCANAGDIDGLVYSLSGG